MTRGTKVEPTNTAGLEGAELRAKELAIFRQRVKVYKLKAQAANRGLTNKFSVADI